MATNVQTPESVLVEGLGKLHPDYSIEIGELPNQVYPYLYVTNGRMMVSTQIRLAKQHWTIKILDRLVVKAIKNIETAPKAQLASEEKDA